MFELAWTILGFGIVLAPIGFYFAFTTTKTTSTITFVLGIIGLLLILFGVIAGGMEGAVKQQKQIEVEKKTIAELNCIDLKQLILQNNKTSEGMQYATSTYLVNCT